MKKQTNRKPKPNAKTWLERELALVAPHLIWNNDDGSVELFQKYRLIKAGTEWWVHQPQREPRRFTTSKIAVSWCIARRHCRTQLSQQLLEINAALDALTADITVRAAAAERSQQPRFCEAVMTKLETKIIRKKNLELQLAKCVNLAKYLYQRGIQNETARLSQPV